MTDLILRNNQKNKQTNKKKQRKTSKPKQGKIKIRQKPKTKQTNINCVTAIDLENMHGPKIVLYS